MIFMEVSNLWKYESRWSAVCTVIGLRSAHQKDRFPIHGEGKKCLSFSKRADLTWGPLNFVVDEYALMFSEVKQRRLKADNSVLSSAEITNA